jgi:hypothetical protein
MLPVSVLILSLIGQSVLHSVSPLVVEKYGDENRQMVTPEIDRLTCSNGGE